jgi:hypothetical protein
MIRLEKLSAAWLDTLFLVGNGTPVVMTESPCDLGDTSSSLHTLPVVNQIPN